MCYTSGTTGNPKGVLYSHRSNVLHTMIAALPDAMGVSSADTIMPVVPMFHANTWGLALTCPMVGASMVMPGAKMDGASIYQLLNDYKVTCTAAVPTVWLMLLQDLEKTGAKLPYLKKVIIGGSACPRAMIKVFQDNYGVEVIHAWGMTEMSPLGTLGSLKPEYAKLTGEEKLDIQQKQGTPPFGVEMKITDDANKALPWDGKTFGRLKVRGPAVASAYFKVDNDPAFEEDGWFDTGDVATVDQYGYMQITDRSKDVIKSGGEWISSIDLENLAVGHPKVAEAAVIGVAHPKWDERPLLVIVLKKGESADQGRHPRLHAGQDRQMVDAGRRGVRRRDPAHRDRQDPEGDAAAELQGLSAAERGGGGVALPLTCGVDARHFLRSSRTRLALNSVFGSVPRASTSTSTRTSQRVRISRRSARSGYRCWCSACSQRTVITSRPDSVVDSTISNSSPMPFTARSASSICDREHLDAAQVDQIVGAPAERAHGARHGCARSRRRRASSTV